ncbi:hypothetical protein OIU85_007959 [Salix viminalis]|uniref:Uncharacterized protein n=1 Tax=Salix viminalis TaxID=40686 RepID=A0A9Q0P9T5_SALVM|nr:hypothetical protein OIU85_007959 [Salix viminalis]
MFDFRVPISSQHLRKSNNQIICQGACTRQDSPYKSDKEKLQNIEGIEVEEAWPEFTRRLKPVTLVKEVAIEAPESDSSLRCPAIITDTTWSKYSVTDTTTIGAARQLTLLSSSTKASHVSTHLFSSVALWEATSDPSFSLYASLY